MLNEFGTIFSFEIETHFSYVFNPTTSRYCA